MSQSTNALARSNAAPGPASAKGEDIPSSGPAPPGSSRFLSFLYHKWTTAGPMRHVSEVHCQERLGQNEASQAGRWRVSLRRIFTADTEQLATDDQAFETSCSLLMDNVRRRCTGRCRATAILGGTDAAAAFGPVCPDIKDQHLGGIRVHFMASV